MISAKLPNSGFTNKKKNKNKITNFSFIYPIKHTLNSKPPYLSKIGSC